MKPIIDTIEEIIFSANKTLVSIKENNYVFDFNTQLELISNKAESINLKRKDFHVARKHTHDINLKIGLNTHDLELIFTKEYFINKILSLGIIDKLNSGTPNDNFKVFFSTNINCYFHEDPYLNLILPGDVGIQFNGKIEIFGIGYDFSAIIVLNLSFYSLKGIHIIRSAPIIFTCPSLNTLSNGKSIEEIFKKNFSTLLATVLEKTDLPTNIFQDMGWISSFRFTRKHYHFCLTFFTNSTDRYFRIYGRKWFFWNEACVNDDCKKSDTKKVPADFKYTLSERIKEQFYPLEPFAAIIKINTIDIRGASGCDIFFIILEMLSAAFSDTKYVASYQDLKDPVNNTSIGKDPLGRYSTDVFFYNYKLSNLYRRCKSGRFHWYKWELQWVCEVWEEGTDERGLSIILYSDIKEFDGAQKLIIRFFEFWTDKTLREIQVDLPKYESALMTVDETNMIITLKNKT